MIYHYSPSLKILSRFLAPLDRKNVLDLGAASATVVDFCRKTGCRLQVEDFYQPLKGRIVRGVDFQPGEIEAYFSDSLGDHNFDAVLGWDLLNYLTLPAIEELFQQLRKHLNPGTLLYILIYTDDEIPKAPRKIKIDEKDAQLLLSSYRLRKRDIPPRTDQQLLMGIPQAEIVHQFYRIENMHPGIRELLIRFN